MMPTAPTPRSTRRARARALWCLSAGLLWLILSAPAPAQDREQPIRIQSDTATLDDQRGISVYRGNVIVTQGELVIHSDLLTVHTPGRALTRMEAEGAPVRLRTVTEDGREVRAEARHMDYLADDRHVVLTGEVRIWQAEDEFRGERIVYNLERETLDASSGETGRVEVIITPREPR